jgi:hypothetical protein
MITRLGPVLFSMVFLFLNQGSRETIGGLIQEGLHKVDIYAPFSYIVLVAPLIAVVALLVWPSKPEEPHYYDE